MGDKLGLEMKAYRNTGSFGTPVWDEVTNVKDLSFDFEKAKADVTTRASVGWRQSRGTLKDGNASFQMLYDTSDADFVYFQNSFLSNTTFEMAFADGTIATTGTQYIRMLVDIFNFSRSENLEEGVLVDVEVGSAPAPVGEEPQLATTP